MKCPHCNKEIEEGKKEEERGESQKKGMLKKASMGKPMSRAPFGYVFSNHELVPSKNSRDVQDLFEDFLEKDMNLTKLSKKYGFSINVLKKILSNFTYIGKIKFNGQIHNGMHKPLISSTLFHKVQDKLNS